MYARVHFKSEEFMLERSGCIDLQVQAAEHARYEAHLAGITMNSLMNVVNRVRLQDSPVGWWSDHIQMSNMKHKGQV
jgi:hemerythrin